MSGPSVSRALRLSAKDVKDIDRFLAENPIFDFSTLARVAIRQFIESPNIKIKGIQPESARSKRRGVNL